MLISLLGAAACQSPPQVLDVSSGIEAENDSTIGVSDAGEPKRVGVLTPAPGSLPPDAALPQDERMADGGDADRPAADAGGANRRRADAGGADGSAADSGGLMVPAGDASTLDGQLADASDGSILDPSTDDEDDAGQ